MNYTVKTNWYTIKRVFLLIFTVLLVVVVSPSLYKNSSQTLAEVSKAPTTKGTDVVIDWNQTTISVTQAAKASSPAQYRTLAIAHAAIFDAVNAINHKYTSYAVDIKAPVGASVEAAAAAAGHTVLTHLYPSGQQDIDKALATSLGKIPEGQSKIDGINIGREVAEKLVALRAKDGADTKVDYKPKTGTGFWQPTPPYFDPALVPQWGSITPFTFKSIDQFQVPAPPAITSAEYIKDLKEVKNIGGKNSTIRTSDQTAAAIFWTLSTPVIWNQAAKAAAIANGSSLVDNARLFAVLNLAGADAYIAGYGVKYKYNRWRPVTAIRNADAIGNGLSADPNWEPLIVTPPHPDYISGHCVSSDAAKRVLQKYFGNDHVKLTFTSPANIGVTRSYTSFSQLSKEVGDARVWGGIHTRTADVQGGLLGDRIGEYAFDNFLQPI